MKKLLFYLISTTVLLVAGCSKFDDSEIWNKLNSLESRVATLEQLCKQMNTNISSLQTIVEALQNKDYVTNIAPITEDGKVIGYSLTFSKSGSITIYHGKDGKDGANGINGTNGTNGTDGRTPQIGIKKDADGIYYWTLDGDWLLDDDGNRVKAVGLDGKNGTDGVDGTNGTNGTNGTDGITPKLKIDNGYWYISYDNGATWTKLDKAVGEDGQNGINGHDGVTPKLKIDNGYWYISYDNGVTWTMLDKAVGEDGKNGENGIDGDSMFKDVTYDYYYVYITLIDGSVIEIPRRKLASNEILYTSTDGKIIIPNATDAFGANIVSNKYENGRGVIIFDGSVTSIGDKAFGDTWKSCITLESITIPESVVTIGKSAFRGCTSLKNIIIPDNVTTIEEYAFENCAGITTINIPDGVTAIGKNAFARCSAIANIIIPNGVATIGDHAFYACTSLTNVAMSDSVTSIDSSAFARCTALTSVTIPKGVTSIGASAFYACTALATVYCRAVTPPTLNINLPFNEIPTPPTIYVPTASAYAYRTAGGWSYYLDYIEGFDF